MPQIPTKHTKCSNGISTRCTRKLLRPLRNSLITLKGRCD
nr:MAG TPA: hypothetical protein [Bacteriophage sp.]